MRWRRQRRRKSGAAAKRRRHRRRRRKQNKICARCCLCLLKDSEVVKIREQFYWCIGIPVLIQRDLAVSSVRNRRCKYLLHEINVLDSFRSLPQYFLIHIGKSQRYYRNLFPEPDEQSVDNLLIIFRMKDNDTAPQ